MNDIIFTRIMVGDFDAYTRLIEDTDINIKNERGASLLQIAIAYRRNDIALDLIARGIQLNQLDGDLRNELQTALYTYLSDVAIKLISCGVDLNHRDRHGNNALWYAATHPKRDLDLVRLLVEKGSDTQTKNDAGRSPLSAAQERGDKELLEVLQSGDT